MNLKNKLAWSLPTNTGFVLAPLSVSDMPQKCADTGRTTALWTKGVIVLELQGVGFGITGGASGIILALLAAHGNCLDGEFLAATGELFRGILSKTLGLFPVKQEIILISVFHGYLTR